MTISTILTSALIRPCAIGVGQPRFCPSRGARDRGPSPNCRAIYGLGIVAEFLVREEDFDLTVCQELAVDHGIYSWLPYVMDLPWSVPITPIAVNMMPPAIAHVPPSPSLPASGTALRRAVVATFDSDERVLIVATGAMSHQISGDRFGPPPKHFSRYFLRALHALPT